MSMMDTAERLVALAREGKNFQAIEELYSERVVSVEAQDSPTGSPRTVSGLEAVEGKNKWWKENHEIHEASVRGPFPHGDDRFAVLYEYDVTFVPAGQRFRMEEVAVYTVEDERIVKEEFFYDM